MTTSSARRPARGAAFTLIELLVVMAVISVLIGLTLSAVQRVRVAAARAACANNLKQIGLALHNYHATHGQLPAGGVTEGPCCNSVSKDTWTIHVLPYLEQEALYRKYDFSKFNEDPANAVVRTTFVKVYACPADPGPFTPVAPESGPGGSGVLYMPGSYRGVSGMSDGEGFFDNYDPKHPTDLTKPWRGPLHTVWKPLGLGAERLTDIQDGTSSTLLVGEYATSTHPNRRTLWACTYTSYNQSSAVAQARTLVNDYDRCQAIGGPGDPNACKRGWGSFHGTGVNFVMCDGSVRWVSQSVDLNTFTALATIAAGDAVGAF
jgi:prepilin-type N-terminal cleavage/methylation domain-containing protein/prepilin-type processing-associated H-X9-DG protein